MTKQQQVALNDESGDANNEELPPIDEANNESNNFMNDTWETGLRRRRGRDTIARGSGGNEDSSPPVSTNEGRNDRNHDGMTHNNNSQGGSGMGDRNNVVNEGRYGHATIGGGHYSSGIGASGPCGGAVDTLTTSAAGPMGGIGGSALNTPYKTPTKGDVVGDLVPATPGSATTAGETVASTVCCSLTMEDARQLQFGRRGNRRGPTTPTLRRQYQILQSQTFVLLGSASIGFVLFLVFFLPFAALISLALMMTSLAALVPVALSTLQTRYQLELEHPLGLLRYLPESLRTLLTETTLHDYMTDTTFLMENRHLFLYFIPGLDPDQLMGYIQQLPPRHRDALLQPGLGRLMPSIMNRLVRMDGSRGATDTDLPLLENGDRGDASVLTFDRDEHESDESGGDAEMEVTLLEAISTLRQAVVGSSSNRGVVGNTESSMPLRSRSVRIEGLPSNNAAADPANNDDTVSITDDVAGIEVVRASANVDERITEPITRSVVVELPPSSDFNSGENSQQNTLDNRQQEYDLEERVLSEATSAAVANYSAQASAAVTESGVEAVETASSWLIRAGSLTGFFAGGGGIVAAVFAHRPSSSSLAVTLGSMSDFGSADSSGGAPGRNSGYSDNDSGSRSGTSSRLMHGLLATSAFGFVSAGFAYFIRSRVRAAIAANRESKPANTLEDKSPNEGAKKKP